MCRFFCYIGESINIYNILYEYENSIFKQCYQLPYTPGIDIPNPRDNAINVDGFGIGIYQNTENPFIYTSIKTPWSDINLKRICQYMTSNLFFAHIRGVKPFNENSFIHELNCHPFRYGKYIMQHNGFISKYKKIKPAILSILNKNAIEVIQGNVDSEDIFALFINNFEKDELEKDLPLDKICEYLMKAIKTIVTLNNNASSSFNIAISDGQKILCIRYINSEEEQPPSLYYQKNNDNIIICSEPIKYNDENWILIPKNHALFIENSNCLLKKI